MEGEAVKCGGELRVQSDFSRSQTPSHVQSCEDLLNEVFTIAILYLLLLVTTLLLYYWRYLNHLSNFFVLWLYQDKPNDVVYKQ